jgi:uncharacterized protein (TIGR03435 family)
LKARESGVRLLLLAGVLGFALSGLAQTSATPAATGTQPSVANVKPLEFDAVSIKPNKTDSNVMLDKTPKDGYAVEHYTVRLVIGAAYGIRWDLISGGPGWIDTSYFDIVAKVAGEDVEAYRKLSKRERNAMVQAVLADRFKLVAHVETKEMPGYELGVAKNGPKLQETKFKRQGFGANPGDYHVEAITMQTLAELLSQTMQRTVMDKTGLTGKYDFELKWAVDRARAPAADDIAASEPSGPTLFTALEEQLGLKLNAVKAPVDTLVIDHVELPTGN